MRIVTGILCWLAGSSVLLCPSCSNSAPISRLAVPACRVDWRAYRYVCEGQAEVKGSGKAAENAALVRARQSAVNATVNLITVTRVSGKETGQAFMGNPVVRKKIYMIVSAQKPGLSKIASLGGKRAAIVWLSVPMLGKGTPGSVLLSEMYRLRAKNSEPPVNSILEASMKIAMKSETPTRLKDTVDSNKIGYTALILDATGLKIERTMSPQILKENGDLVWTGEGIDLEDVQEFGVVAYCKSLDLAKQNPRSGVRPLIVRVIRTAGKQSCDIVISETEANNVLAEEKKCGFLAAFNVIIASD